ncbi:MAG: urease subunit beta [Pseudomonadota bacterium]
MHLTPTEMERLVIFQVAELARRYRDKGIRLSAPEATGLICDEIITVARQGMDHPAMVDYGASILTSDDVEPGVAALIPVISVEVMMEEGTKLVTVFDPIKPGSAPDESVTPGEYILAEGEIEINAGREAIEIEVLNTGDRTIQIRSHAHFFEANKALKFDRAAAFGMKLDRPSGGGERFDPGIARIVRLVPFGGLQRMHGFAGLAEGGVESKDAAIARAVARGYMEAPE